MQRKATELIDLCQEHLKSAHFTADTPCSVCLKNVSFQGNRLMEAHHQAD
jgi:hypothetical protein